MKRLQKETIVRVVIEATGRCKHAFVMAALAADLLIIVANSLTVRRYAGAIGLLAETDSTDSPICCCAKARGTCFSQRPDLAN